MQNNIFLSTLGIPVPYRMCYNKNYNSLTDVNNQNDSGFVQIAVPFVYYSIEKMSFNYKAWDGAKLAYAVTETFFKLVPGSDPVHNIRFAEETGDPLRNKKEFCKYSRQGSVSSDVFLNCVFNNKSKSIGWDFNLTFGVQFTGDLSVWMEFSGNYYQ